MQAVSRWRMRWGSGFVSRIGPLFLFPLLALSTLAGVAAPPKATPPKPAKPPKAVASAKGKRPLVSYTEDIRPILAENCFACHGTDHNKRMAGLRLDQRAAALVKSVIVPGSAEKSQLIARIVAHDDRMMPPAYSHKHLTNRQKALLIRWIEEGARYEPHWAFVPLPPRVNVPPVHDKTWPLNTIDRFVLARLEKVRISPSPDSLRSTWLRRVTLDLTGLPPTIAEVDSFLADTSTKAYEKVVDRLLASPHYGERMALPWLDIARYADSYGYQSDQLCPTWPYRDWVIRAFNDNLSYDKFITYQLAGDLIPHPTRETRLATAFNRLHRMTNEGGSVPDEWREEGVADRVKTFGMAFIGMSTECARCHDHKYDPITQRDFYSLTAFFNSIDEHGLYDQAGIIPTPSLLLPTPEQETALKTATQAAQQAQDRLVQRRAEREAAFQQWLASKPQAVLPDQTGKFDFEAIDGNKLKNLLPGATEGGETGDTVPLVPGVQGLAAAFDGENNVHFPALGRFTRQTPFTIAFRMRDARLVDGEAVVYQACDGTDTGPFGYDLTVRDGYLTARMMRHWPGNAIAIRTTQPIPKDTWTAVAVTYDGSSHASGLHLYVNGRLADTSIVRDNLYKGVGQHTLVFGQRFRDRGFKGGQIDDLSLFERDITPLEVAQLVDGHSLADALAQPKGKEDALREYYLSAIDSEVRTEAKTLASTRGAVVNAEDGQFEISVMEEMPLARPTFVLARGRYDAPVTDADRVARTTPSGIYPYPKSLRRNRLGLAQWLLLPQHPLTARVAVNRLWSLCFGRGLVETEEDFGIQGRPPTHPALLDYLARDFIASGWDVKRMMRQIVLSHTYRQSSALRPELQERDPQNLLLARGPSHRLAAEAIRDVALASGGLLSDRLGGPPVSPYQPGDLWRETNSMSPGYQQSKGSDLYRRSLYTVWKRTAPMPNMTAFDAVSREVCTARRGATNTPLQALVLLDDPQFVEAARALAERTIKEGGATVPQRVEFAFRQLVGRAPTPQELLILVNLYGDQRMAFSNDPTAAAKLIHIGESKPDPNLPPVELATATVLAQTILNLDATIWKR